MAKAPGKPWPKQAAGPQEKDLMLKMGGMLHVYTDTQILSGLTGEYHIIAEETTYDQLIASLTKNAFMLLFPPHLTGRHTV